MQPSTRTRFLGGFTLAAVVAAVLAGCTAAPAAPAVSSCGPGGHTTGAAAQERWTPCDYDYRTANVFVRGVLQVLPTSGVTAAAVDAAAASDTLRAQQFGAAAYSGTTGSGGTLAATWMPAPATCVVMTWDGAAWHSVISGELVAGGC
ncbi:hypothetical protein BH11ACT4_BH11ACT4_08520 [soil metagenome]